MGQSGLGRYLNDHLSGSEVAARLLRRLNRRYRGTAQGRFFAVLLADIRADQEALRELARRVGATRTRHRFRRPTCGPRRASRHSGR